MDRILGKSWWPDVCHLAQGAHTPYTRGIPWVKSPERVRLTGGRACWRERGHSYRSISSYRKLAPPACPGTTCMYGLNLSIQISIVPRSARLRLPASSQICCVKRLLLNSSPWVSYSAASVEQSARQNDHQR